MRRPATWAPSTAHLLQRAPVSPIFRCRRGLRSIASATARRSWQSLDNVRRDLDGRGEFEALDTFTAQALDIVTSREVREAFDLSKEPEKVVARYGYKGAKYEYNKSPVPWEYESFIHARRLVEAGVPYVSLQVGLWDHHGGDLQGSIFNGYRSMLPLYDQSLSALIEDLYERGLDRDVAVIVWGEFGRTPKVNPGGGSDHWPQAGCALFVGGGLKMGQIVGATDATAAAPTNSAVWAAECFGNAVPRAGDRSGDDAARSHRAADLSIG